MQNNTLCMVHTQKYEIYNNIVRCTDFPQENKMHTSKHHHIYFRKPLLCNRVYCIHVPGHDPITFSFWSFSFLIGWGFMAQLSKVLEVVCWAGSIPFPPVSLQRQVVCLLLWPVFMCSSQGRAYTVSWLVGVQIKVML